MAWFGTAPRPVSQKVQAQATTKTRGQKIKDDGGTPLLPHVDAETEYLLAVWTDVGRCMRTGMGIAPLTAGEIEAWQRGMGRTLTPPEFGAVMKMSRAYTAELQAAEDPNCPPPFGMASSMIDKVALGKRLGDALMALKKGTTREHRKTNHRDGGKRRPPPT